MMIGRIIKLQFAAVCVIERGDTSGCSIATPPGSPALRKETQVSSVTKSKPMNSKEHFNCLQINTIVYQNGASFHIITICN